MRQFFHILVVIYVILGLGTGLAFYWERDKDPRHQGLKVEVALDAVTVGLLWPFYIRDFIAEHDAPRQQQSPVQEPPTSE